MGGLIKGILGSSDKGLSQADMIRMQEDSANRERDRLKGEEAAKKEQAKQDFVDKEKRRLAAASTGMIDEDEENRKRFLQGA